MPSVVGRSEAVRRRAPSMAQAAVHSPRGGGGQVKEYGVECGAEIHRVRVHTNGALSFPDHPGVAMELEELETLALLGNQPLSLYGCTAFLHYWRKGYSFELRRLTGEPVHSPAGHRGEAPERSRQIKRGPFVRTIWDDSCPFAREMLIRSVLFVVGSEVGKVEVAGWFRWAREDGGGIAVAPFIRSPWEYGRLVVRGYNVCRFDGELYVGLRFRDGERIEVMRGPHCALHVLSLCMVEPVGKALGRLSFVHC